MELKCNVLENVSYSDTRNGLLSAAESERALPYPDVARWVSTAVASGGTDSEVR